MSRTSLVWNTCPAHVRCEKLFFQDLKIKLSSQRNTPRRNEIVKSTQYTFSSGLRKFHYPQSTSDFKVLFNVVTVFSKQNDIFWTDCES